MKTHIECQCGERYTFAGSVRAKYTCPDCGTKNAPLTPEQEKLLAIIDTHPGEWIYPNRFSVKASVGGSLFRRGIVERRFEKAPYHWAMYRRNKIVKATNHND